MKANHLSGFYGVSDGTYQTNSRGRGTGGLFNRLSPLSSSASGCLAPQLPSSALSPSSTISIHPLQPLTASLLICCQKKQKRAASCLCVQTELCWDHSLAMFFCIPVAFLGPLWALGATCEDWKRVSEAQSTHQTHAKPSQGYLQFDSCRGASGLRICFFQPCLLFEKEKWVQLYPEKYNFIPNMFL